MTQEHPITPPPELVKEWRDLPEYLTTKLQGIATQAARWGADQELEACCEWVRESDGYDAALALRADRRPKPPSLKEQALALIGSDFENQPCLSEEGFAILCRALESLPD